MGLSGILIYSAVYVAAKIGLAGVSWLMMSKARKNISEHIELLEHKPSANKKPRTMALTMRRKLTRIIPPAVLVPGFGEVLFVTVALGRFSNKAKIKKIYLKSLKKTEDYNLYDAVNKLGDSNRSIYKALNRNAGYLSAAGHAEIARQSIITLNNLIVEANIAGIDLRRDSSIAEAVNNTAGLVSDLLREEQSGVQSNIDTYLNVVGSIKKDLAARESVFMEAAMSAQGDTHTDKQ